MKRTLAARCAIAIVLMIIFYALAVVAIVGLAYLGVEVFKTIPEIRGRGIVITGVAGTACFASAGVVAWSILPRLDRFEAPGPELDPDEHPELFAEIESIGAATGERIPSHVYLVSDVNAFVAERGGMMGIGSKRVMGIGLPLLKLLTVSQLRGVIAHEFGHYFGGDTKLGPWIYKTRGAMVRTVTNLSDAQGAASDSGDGYVALVGFLFSIVRKPFYWFGSLFLRITQAISRAQEYTADAIAARIVGSDALADGLKAVTGGARAYSAYFEGEYAPLVGRGFRAGLVEGFDTFLTSSKVEAESAQALSYEMAHGRQDPYDSHPPLRDRVAALEKLALPVADADDRSALVLVSDLEQLESRLVTFLTDGAELGTVDWEDVIEVVYEPRWRESAEAVYETLFEGLTPLDIPNSIIELRELEERETGDQIYLVDPSVVVGLAFQWFGAGLAVLLLDAGFVASTSMAGPFVFTRGVDEIEPWTILNEYLGGEMTREDWNQRWENLAVGDRPLAVADSLEPVG